MQPLQQLETQLDDAVNKKLPFQLPENGRKGLAVNMWWISLVIGLLQLWAAWGLWHLGRLANQVADWANSLANVYGTGEHVDKLGLFFYVSLAVVVVDAALMLIAVPGLKAMDKVRGWNLLYLSLLLNVLYGIVRLFSSVGGGFGNLLSALIGSALGAYFLFQIRKYFVSASVTAKTTQATKTTEAPKEPKEKKA